MPILRSSVNGQESSVQSPWRKFFGVRKATLRAQNLVPVCSRHIRAPSWANAQIKHDSKRNVNLQRVSRLDDPFDAHYDVFVLFTS